MFAVILLALLITVPIRADLRDTDNSADYIILTNQEVLSNNAWIGDLLAYREAQGRTAMAVTVEEIWDEFTPSNQNGIRDFLHYAYENWQEPRLKDVFIVGHVDVVPSREMHSIADSASYWSDYWYVQGDSALDLEPRFRLGRLPWSSEMGIGMPDYYMKVHAYEIGTVESCEADVELIAGASDLMHFDSLSEQIATQLPGDIEVERDYLERNPSDPDFGDYNEIIAHLSEGSAFTFYMGHFADNGIWVLPDTIRAEEWASFGNFECLTILTGYCGFSLGFGEITNTLGISAILNPNGGAVCELGCSHYTWAMGRRDYLFDLAGRCYDSQATNVGDIWKMTCLDYVDRRIEGTSNSRYETLLSNVLLGDPATIIPGRSTSADPIAAPVVPTTIQIVGNYPNPFNPTTTVSFLLNRAGNAKLAVFDITGRTVATLADRDFTAGQHNLVWDATGLASGMYLVRLEAAGQFDTHKITLLK